MWRENGRRGTLPGMPRKASLPPLEKAMESTPLLTGVPSGAIARFAAEGKTRHYRKGTYVCHQGDPAIEVYFLVDGRVEISSVSTNGSRVFHATVDTPQFVGEMGVLGDMPRTASLLSVQDSQVWTAGGETFLAFLAAQPTATRAVLRALARQTQAQQAFADDLLFLDLKGRVAKRLLQLVTPDLDDLPRDGVVAPQVTQADLASLCGGSRENVTRILAEFQRRGLVRRVGHRYVLKKVAGLAKIADL
jgi:CRP/FNR family cyclic AMP-dependent transcriptional regulator